MKRLSDYKDEEAIDLWADLLEPIMAIVQNPNIKKLRSTGKNTLAVAKAVITECKSEAVEILLRIDPTPINGLNILTRLITLLNELDESEEISDFLGLSSESEQPTSSISATGNTKAKEN